MIVYGPKRIFLIILGLLALGLGTVGVILPILPTTPFILIAAYCFVRSSARLHNWIMNHRRFGPMIRKYQEGKGLTLRVKLFSLGTAYLLVGTTMVLLDNLHVRIFLVILMIAKTLFMIRIPTCPPGTDCLNAREEDL